MKNQPLIDLPTSTFEKLSTSVSFLTISCTFIYLVMIWNQIPETIPVHFNLNGEADRYGGKWSIIALPVISLLIWVTFTMLEKYPHAHNYIVTINTQNAEAQYKNSKLMLSVLKLIIILDFSYLTWSSIQIGLDHQSGLGVWQMLITLAGTLGVIMIFLIRSIRLK
ncbi:DUF1648 domain-containing protein [Halobacillus naozhouensis]|uniref:DUF1648 domain-containing protein n=1 Tax=Halobacillus naozhouensis TaxID=554880 RepID=A0ABY8IW52_9BACI|nr:DUF1648 domain-containing protein [Halobacillus naozhouensis]WFT74444.1 DUF1648 domain-containing protein [Halobacillus naozhouensis]